MGFIFMCGFLCMIALVGFIYFYVKERRDFKKQQYVGSNAMIMTETKSKLSDILMLVSWREVARTYFGKSSSWLYEKFDGINEEGASEGLTEEETQQLKRALEDVASRITRVSETL